MSGYEAHFVPDCFYHVFNHSIDPELLFRADENYRFFLQKALKYLVPIADFYAYNLLGNHYHFFIRIKPEDQIQKRYTELHSSSEKKLLQKQVPDFILQQFSNFQNSYAKSYNTVYHRKGRLFIESVKRIEISTEQSFTNIIHYIHFNAVHHKMCRQIANWPHCSYHSFLSEAPTVLMRKEILDWFGGKEAFIDFHRLSPKNFSEYE
jgi:REP element-mobilizing transposase RayT